MTRSAAGSPLALVLVALLGLALAAGEATAQSTAERYERARAAAEAGRCDEALGQLDAAPRATREHAPLALLAGECHVKAGRYAEALAELDTASELDAGLADVELYRAVSLYHLKRYAEADAAIEAARSNTTDEAQLELYRGLLLLRGQDLRGAALALERARSVGPGRVEPVASYYAGLAWTSLNEDERAREALENVIAIDGENGRWGREARRVLAGRGRGDGGFFAQVTAGIEYDDNVVLRPSGVALPSDISDKEDWRGVWFVDLGAELARFDDTRVAAAISYYGTAQFDLQDFNTQYPTASLWLEHDFSADTSGLLLYEIGHAWIDESPFVLAHTFRLSLFHDWGKPGRTEFAVRAFVNDFEFPTGPDLPGPAGVDESEERDRDGAGFSVGLEQRVPLPMLDGRILNKTFARGGYAFSYYDSEGTEYQYMGHTASVGLETLLPLELQLTANASYSWQPFVHRSTFLDGAPTVTPYSLDHDDRHDRIVSFETRIERAITRWLSVSARYAYTDVESNRNVFDYDRHIVGGYLTARFD